MDWPLDLRPSPWPFSRRPDPPVEGCRQGVQLMAYRVFLVAGTFKLSNYRGDLLLEWDDWDELLEHINVWPQDEKTKKLWNDHHFRSAKLLPPSSGTSVPSPPQGQNTAAAPIPKRSAAHQRRGTSSAKSTKQR